MSRQGVKGGVGWLCSDLSVTYKTRSEKRPNPIAFVYQAHRSGTADILIPLACDFEQASDFFSGKKHLLSLHLLERRLELPLLGTSSSLLVRG